VHFAYRNDKDSHAFPAFTLNEDDWLDPFTLNVFFRRNGPTLWVT
jgi:hypothetical protein